MGNMGYSEAKCQDVGMKVDQIILSCDTGVIGKIVDYGIQSKIEDNTYCRYNSTGQCAKALSSSLNTTLQNCVFNSTCHISGLQKYVTASKTTCLDEDASFHVQYFCWQTEA